MKSILSIIVVFASTLLIVYASHLKINDTEPKDEYKIVPIGLTSYNVTDDRLKNLFKDWPELKQLIPDVENIGQGVISDNYSGLAGGNVSYTTIMPDIDKAPHSIKLLNKKIDYQGYLKSIIKSMMLEYKIYQGQQNLSSYSIFALGNFRLDDLYDVKESYLKFANEEILGNKKRMKVLYNYSLPYLQGVFQSITYQEQVTLLKKIDYCEEYLNSLKGKKEIEDVEKYLDTHPNIDDPKIVKFVYRRLIKDQWKIKDGLKWMKRLREDFESLVINDKENFFQRLNPLGDKWQIVMNHKGKYGVVDEDLNIVVDTVYSYIENDRNDSSILFLFKSFNFYDYQIARISSIENEEKLLTPLKDNWRDQSRISENILLFTELNNINKLSYGLYDTEKNDYLLEDYNMIELLIENEKDYLMSVLACRKNNEIGFYNLKGEKIIDMGSPANEVESYDMNGNLRSYIEINYQVVGEDYIIFRNNDSNYGVIDSNGKLVLPFEYSYIYYNESKNIVKASKEDKDEIYDKEFNLKD